MKFSVITATYNRAETIVRALSSVKRQSHKDIELVVVDGASTDDTLKIISPLLSSGDIVHSSPDDGIYDALNKGVDLASGDIIAFLHSDDLYYDDNVLAIVTDIFSDKNIDIVYGNVVFFSAKDEHEIVRRYNSATLNLSNLSWGKMPPHPAIFCRRRVFEKVGKFKLDYEICADYEFLCRLVKNFNFKSEYTNKTFVKMQVGGASRVGLRNTLLLNREVYKAITSNEIYTNYFMILSKYPSKILEFLNPKRLL